MVMGLVAASVGESSEIGQVGNGTEEHPNREDESSDDEGEEDDVT